MKLLALTLCAALCGAFLVSAPAPALAQDAGALAAPAAAPAPAAEAAEAPDLAERAEADPLAVGLELVDAVRKGNWRLAIALGLALLMVLGAKARDKVKWFRGDRGGALLVMGLSLAGALATALASDAALDWKLFLGAAGVAWTAVGGYTWFKRLVWPKDTD